MKRNRHEKIIELIGKYEIETQEELADKLKNEGYQVTQATVSRDIRQLKLSKIAGEGGRQKYALYDKEDGQLGDKYIRVLKDGYISMDMAQNILVMKTVSGMAMAVAASVDAMKMPEIVGCIAGDDTIMMAIRTVEDTILVMDKIKKMIGT
ncbi:MAG: arginine repressor [Bacillus sp. (in: Bacteria)]|nr:arginine repressor [Bacillus sp. (in: firmicutes)]MCM1425121.1 arginine repressor [Eubacterium sp.]